MVDIKRNHVKVMLIILIVNSITACATQSPPANHTIPTSKAVHTTANVARQEQLAKIEAQRARIARANSIDFENYSIEQLKQVKEQSALKDSYLSEIQRINEGSLMEQIVGIFTIPGLAVKAEVAGARAATAADALNKTNQLLQASNIITRQLLQPSVTGAVDSVAVTANAEIITGRWIGNYECSQGMTGVTLILTGSQNGLVEGIFLFYPTPSNPSAATGRFIVRGLYFSDGSLVLGGGNCIERPENHVVVSLKGKVDLALGTFSGVVPECFNNVFSVKKFFQSQKTPIQKK